MKRAIVTKDGVGITAKVIQKREFYLARVVSELPTLVFVRKGTKTLKRGDLEFVIHEGEAVAIAGGQSFDVVNRPNKEDFEAVWIAFYPSVIQSLASQQEHLSAVDTAFHLSELKSGFADTFQTAIDSITTSKSIPESVAIHRVGETLLWLGEFGKKFKLASPHKTAQKVRSLLTASPAKDWSAAHIADHLEMSEATLRRKLAGEQISFSELLIDVRMSFALSLLQATDLSIGEIAKEVGYESASRFAVRFRDRFGHSPTVLRRETAANERNGTILARVRT